MAAHIPESHRDLIDGAFYAALTTILPDGQPQTGEAQARPPALIDGVNARLIQPADARGLADALCQLADQPALRAQLGASARELASEFGWESIAMRHVDLYQRITRMA